MVRERERVSVSVPPAEAGKVLSQSTVAPGLCLAGRIAMVLEEVVVLVLVRTGPMVFDLAVQIERKTVPEVVVSVQIERKIVPEAVPVQIQTLAVEVAQNQKAMKLLDAVQVARTET